MPRRGEARWGRAESTGEDPAAGTVRPDREHHGRRRSRSPQGESCDDPHDESKVLLHPHEHPELLALKILKHEAPVHHARTHRALAPFNKTASGGGGC